LGPRHRLPDATPLMDFAPSIFTSRSSR
jgi:hypothetical protein